MRLRINWINGISFLLGAVLIYRGYESGAMPVCALGSAIAGGAVGMAYRQQWARWVAAGALAIFASLMAYSIFQQFNAMRLIGIVGVLLLVWEIVKELRAVRDHHNKPLIAFVQLRRMANNFLTDKKLAEIAQRVWGIEFGTAAAGNNSAYVVGRSPAFIVNAPGMTLLVNNFSSPYFEDTHKAAAEMNEMRMRHAIESHAAWLSVDLLSMHDDKRPVTDAYPYLGKIFADLLDDDCTAIYAPETGRVVPYEPGIADQLRGDNPLAAFGEMAFVPVMEIDHEDPRMKEAVADARRRWPEFVDAFNNRAGEHFGVKSPVTVDGKTEFIWIELDAIDGENLRGRLANDPVALGRLKCGDEVMVQKGELNDWAYLQNNEMIGGFTTRVLAQSGKPGATSDGPAARKQPDAPQ